MFALGKRNIHVSVVTWCGDVKIHFRQFTDNEHGQKIPSAKGIALNVDEFLELKANLKSIDESIWKMTYHNESQRRAPCHRSRGERIPIEGLVEELTQVDVQNGARHELKEYELNGLTHIIDDNANHDWSDETFNNVNFMTYKTN